MMGSSLINHIKSKDNIDSNDLRNYYTTKLTKTQSEMKKNSDMKYIPKQQIIKNNLVASLVERKPPVSPLRK